MNPGVFPRHLSWSMSSEHWPCPQDKQLQSSSQFIVSTEGYVRLSRRANSRLPGRIVPNWIPAISVTLFLSYLSFRQACSPSKHIPIVQCPGSSSTYKLYWLKETSNFIAFIKNGIKRYIRKIATYVSITSFKSVIAGSTSEILIN